MGSKFKCCKSKEHNNWFCLVCRNFIHPGCWKRTNHNYVIIKDSFVICSKQCSETAHENDNENIIDELKTIIFDLKSELEQKNNYIKRLKRESLTFIEEAESNESRLLSDFDKQNQKISQLTRQIEELSSVNDSNGSREFATRAVQTHTTSSHDADTQTILNIRDNNVQTEYNSSHINQLEEECKRKESDIQSLKHDFDELKTIHEQMLTTIETLSVENDYYASEVKKMQRIIDDERDAKSLEYELKFSPEIEKSPVVENESTYMKRKILVYGDGSARNYSTHLFEKFNSNIFGVEGKIMSGAPLSAISQNLFNLVTAYDNKDFIIIMLDITRLRKCNYRDVCSLLACGRFANLIFCYKYSQQIDRILLHRFQSCLSTFLDQNINVSIKIIENNTRGSKFAFSHRSLCRLFSECITGNLTTPRIVLKSMALVSNETHNLYSDTHQDVTSNITSSEIITIEDGENSNFLDQQHMARSLL